MSTRYQYPFKGKIAIVDGIKIHYVDEGQGPVIWMMHGNPTWSYLYRKMIPILVKAGYRCFVPDLMGFGLSYKSKQEKDYTLRRHVELMTKLIDHLKLKDIITIGQDWGGPITLRYAIDHKKNIQALVILNTFIERSPQSFKEKKIQNRIGHPLPLPFKLLFKSGAFSSYLIKNFDLFRKFVFAKWQTGNKSKLGSGFRRPVDPRAMRNYLNVHARPDDRAGVAAFPKMIPHHRRHPNAAYLDEIGKQLKSWSVPKFVAFADNDIAFKLDEGHAIAATLTNTDFYLVKNAGHYLQEDAGEEIAEKIVVFLSKYIKSTKHKIKTKVAS